MSASRLLTPTGRAAWRAIEPKLRRRGVLWDGLAGGQFELFCLCAGFELYRFDLTMAARSTGRARRQWLRAAEEARLHVRQCAAKFFDMIPASRVRLAPVGRDGEDQEITAWFTPERRSPRRRETRNAH